MTIINVITPMARLRNIPELIAMLETKNIHWHVITDHDATEQPKFEQAWIHHYICPNISGSFFERCNNSINWWIDTYSPIKDQMYCIMNDDDGYEPDFFDKVRDLIQQHKNQSKNHDVIIVSMERGSQTPPLNQTGALRQHQTFKLWAQPQNMAPGGVGVEQIILSGKILEMYRLPLLVDGDGRWISGIVHRHAPVYAPHINSWFNYFEPGRWNP
jgi:hypothetical protein